MFIDVSATVNGCLSVLDLRRTDLLSRMKPCIHPKTIGGSFSNPLSAGEVVKDAAALETTCVIYVFRILCKSHLTNCEIDDITVGLLKRKQEVRHAHAHIIASHLNDV